MDNIVAIMINSKATADEKLNIEEQIIECEKSSKPVENIICPRCGENIAYKEVGNSYTVECKVPDCIKYSVRGL